MIDKFSGDNRFLSNFQPCKVEFEELEYGSVEHAYQAAKCITQKERKQFLGITAKEAKALGKKVKLREDWEQVKIDVMRSLLEQKFKSGSVLAGHLILTGNQELVEGNWWGDTFWGVCNGKGENWLGKLLMERRKILQQGSR
jgi:ribA/ribD-fused uncharacterized protein